MDQPPGKPPCPVPARAALVRRLYLEGASMAEIRRQTGLSSAGAYYWIDREVAADGTVTFRPVPRRSAQPVGGKSTAAATGKPDRRGLLRRLWRAAERQIDEIEQRLAHGQGSPPEGEAPRAAADTEKDARALAVLARTLRELSALEAEARKTRKPKAKDDAVRDLDTFRRELARRLDRLGADGDGADPAGEPA